ncbi:MAG TPA: hypothetical protein VFP50_15410 [Anaeromyxobacteraceae bacterium]|nr:hypothetical protein [Anaeromyxobacteraceae bacterium]
MTQLDDDGSPYDMDSDDTLSQLSPKEMRKLLSLGTAPDRERLLQQQLLQAQALRSEEGQRHATPMGALFGGIANVARSAIGAAKEKDLNQQMGDLWNGQVDARQMLLQKLLGPRRPPAQAQPSEMGAGDFTPSGTFGLG